MEKSNNLPANHQDDFNPETNVSPRNRIHDQFLYSDFREFLHSECTIDTTNPFIRKHENAIRTVAEEGTNVWDDKVRDELEVLVHDIEELILPAKNQGQQVEQGVQLTDHCTGNGRNESTTSAFVVVKSFDHQKVTMQHMQLLNSKPTIRPNQHMNKERTSTSKGSKRKEGERAENNVTYKSHSQATKEKAKLYMDLARNDSYFEAPVEIRKKMLDTAKRKKKKCDSIQTMNRIRKEQKVESLTKAIERNEKRKSGERRGRPRRASDVDMVELRKPVSETQEIGVNNFTR